MIDVPAYTGWIIAAVSCGIVAAIIFYRWDEKNEDDRREAIDLADVLRDYGLRMIPKFLRSFAVGDISGMIRDIKAFWQLLQMHPDAVVAEFDEVFKRVLDKKVRTPEGRAYIQSVLDEATQAPIIPTRVNG